MRCLLTFSLSLVLYSATAGAMSVSQRYAFEESAASVGREVCVPVRGALSPRLTMHEEVRKNGGYIGTAYPWHYFTSYESCAQGIREDNFEQ